MSGPPARGLAAAGTAGGLAHDVRRGLGRKTGKEIPSRWLYDDVGSALFEAISLLPEYGLTRADERILLRSAGEIAGFAAGPVRVAELGSGSGRKTRWLLRALGPRLAGYHPIDVSAAALARCVAELAGDAAGLLRPFEAPYIEGLIAAAARRRPDETMLVLFLGSTVGNMHPPERRDFLSRLASLLTPGDALLLGTDLQRDEARLLPAYDDPAGITASFNLNVLARINRELDGGFDLRRFRHAALYDPSAGRVEMRLVSSIRQTAPIRGIGLKVAMEAGEPILTEVSYKMDLRSIEAIALEAGLTPAGQWRDDEWPFAETLLVSGGAPSPGPPVRPRRAP
ncbi:MAG TPA: L-histidine N(alpha)-methyltransferase [Candidatus Polarisedimenticolia bacterium]|nr:L-histidine N(alpha)-methyltransferase [Candidatus Polarisedimenticolia bacterium]